MKIRDYIYLDDEEEDDREVSGVVPLVKKPQKMVNKPKQRDDNIRRARQAKQRRQEMEDSLFNNYD